MADKIMFHASNPIGDAALFQNEETEEYILYYKQAAFTPRLVRAEDLVDIKDFIIGRRIMSETQFNRLTTTDEVVVGIEEDVEPEAYDITDQFDEIVED